MAVELDQVEVGKIFRIDDIDKPIFRIFRQWDLQEAVRLKRLTLVPPRFWEDPFEVIESMIGVTYQDDGVMEPQVILGQDLPSTYAQCWSATADSDTLLRAYSRVVKDPRHQRNICPGDEGVKVRTTPRKLMGALLQARSSYPQASFFIGDVKYSPMEALLQNLTNEIARIGLNIFDDPANRVNLLLKKRDGFSHENEVRIGAALIKECDKSETVLSFDFDVNEVFEEITFDPRLIAFERLERERDFVALGFKGSFGESNLYQKIMLDIFIQR